MPSENDLVKSEKDLSNSEFDESAILEDDQEEYEDDLIETTEKKEETHQLCVFKIGGIEYAIPIAMVKEVVKYTEPAILPHMPKYILGATNIRGNVFGVLDLRIFFDLKNSHEHEYLLVLDHETYKMALGIPLVPDSLIVKESNFENINSSLLKSEVGQRFIKGIIKIEDRKIIMIDIEGIVSSHLFLE